MPGDVIATGTPGGVGFARTPPVWLMPGDVVEVDGRRHRHHPQQRRRRPARADRLALGSGRDSHGCPVTACDLGRCRHALVPSIAREGHTHAVVPGNNAPD